MATVPTPEISIAGLARPEEPLIEPPQPVVRAEGAIENPTPDTPRDAAAVYSPGHRGDSVDPDRSGSSADSAGREHSSGSEDSASPEDSGDGGSLGVDEPETAAVGQSESHQINFFA
ncbi:MAG: hypothetical protein ACLGQU_01505 [Acidobacteriota bacterium]